jgi:hypothetical protein
MHARLRLSDLARLALAWAISSLALMAADALLLGLHALVIGADGHRRLRDGVVSGTDPLEDFAPHASWALLRAVEMPSAPDIYVNSAVDAATLEVSAFEDLVGAHGGLGGWQDRGLLIGPAHLVDRGREIHGAQELHEVLVEMLVRLGQRADLTRASGMVHQ